MNSAGYSVTRTLGRGPGFIYDNNSQDSSSVWSIFRDLVAARSVLGISSQALGTLRALISFLRPSQETVIFASNRALSDRADGLSERSVRRHLSELIAAGVVARKSSANGKRFKVKNPDGPEDTYGLDLRPLLMRAMEIADLAQEAAREQLRIKLQRKRLSALIFEAEALIASEEIAQYRRSLRRKHSSTYFASLCDELSQILQNIASKTEDGSDQTSTLTLRDSQSDRHKIKSNKEDLDSDSAENADIGDAALQHERKMLRTVAETYPDALGWSEQPVTTWQRLEALAWTLAAWCGVDEGTRQRAYAAVGPIKFICASLHTIQAGPRIKKPAAYFASLTIGKHQHSFNPPVGAPI